MIYILKFDRPLGSQNPRGQARYYIGYCDDGNLDSRLEDHRTGAGAAITRACVRRGIGFELVLTLPGDRTEERKLKNRKSTPKLVQQLLKKRGVE